MAWEGPTEKAGPFSPTAGGDRLIIQRVKNMSDEGSALAQYNKQLAPFFKMNWQLQLELISFLATEVKV